MTMGKNSARKKLKTEIKREEDRQYNLVRAAQAKSNPLSEFPAFTQFNRNGLNVVIDYYDVEQIDKETLAWILCLEKKNMEDIYNSCSWGWKEKKKIEEMTATEARYLIARDPLKPVAFAHFRFDMDFGDAVLYCYELQLEPSVRRKGLGKFLLQILELLAFKNNMKKVVLTVLKHNTAAVEFFTSLKYEPDETNPVENAFEKLPYEILSKRNRKIPN